MGLKLAIQKVVENSFQAFGDLPTSVTYTAKGNTTYSPSAGTIVSADTDYDVAGILTSYESNEIDDKNILITDQKFLIPTRDLTPTPATDDTITIGQPGDTVVWQVVNKKTDPANAMWFIQIRKP